MANLNEITLGAITPTKMGVDLVAESIVEQVSNGHVNALELAIKFNALEQLCKAVKDKSQQYVIDELYKHPKQKAEIGGVSVALVDSVKYDFSHLPGWEEINEQISSLKESLKEIEDKEKEYHKGDLPIKSATTTFRINLPK